MTDPATGEPDHTLYRPTDLDAVRFDMPVVVWANGGCRRSNRQFFHFLSQLASYGYFVIANGAPTHPYIVSEREGLRRPADPAKLTRAMDWALAADEDRSGPFFGRLDRDRIVVMGQSCGGREAALAAGDERAATVVLWNPYCPERRCHRKLRTPTLIVSGGRGDRTYTQTAGTYRNASDVPIVWADNAGAGHTGMWDDPRRVDASRDPTSTPTPTPLRDEPLVVAWRWLDFVLYDSESSEAYFFGDRCGLCTREGWTVRSKGWTR